MSDAEIRDRFQEQIDTFRAVRENPELGAARGLVLTNVLPAAEADAGATVAAPGGLTLPAKTDAELAAAAADAPETAHWSLPEDRQVNVQVRFAFDSAALEESERAKLRQICGVLDEMGIEQLRVVGHTDASGAAGYNQQLSVLRAEEVERFFVNDCGIDDRRGWRRSASASSSPTTPRTPSPARTAGWSSRR